MKHVIGDIKAGTDVWMIFQELHETKPLCVTVLADDVSTEYLMPHKSIEVKYRDGVAKYMESFIQFKTLAFYNEYCWDTEEEAQQALNDMIAEQKEQDEKLRKRMIDFACSYIIENNLVFANESERDTFINGFVACAIDIKHNPMFASNIINR